MSKLCTRGRPDPCTTRQSQQNEGLTPIARRFDLSGWQGVVKGTLHMDGQLIDMSPTRNPELRLLCNKSPPRVSYLLCHT